jgi:2'-5' RNA ligase
MQRAEKWQELPVRWISEENLHITLLFLGHIGDENIPNICEKIRRSSEQIEAFDIMLEEIILAPNPAEPKMIWLIGKSSERLKILQENIEKKLGTFQREKKSFRPHVTLGRIRKNKWKDLPVIPEIKEKFSVLIPVGSIDILESVVEDGKRKYLLLENCQLG